MKRIGTIVPALAIALGLATVASAHGMKHDGGPHGRFHHGPDRLVERLVFPCRAGCFDTSRACFQTAASTAESCARSSCGSEITAAQNACKAGRTSGCQSAVAALRSCATSCTDTAATSFAACKNTMSSCTASCGQS